MSTEKAQQYISNDAIHESPKAIPVPTKTALLNLTKDKIIEEGKKLGIELNEELTRAEMVVTILAQVKINTAGLLKESDPKSILDSYTDGYTG